MSLCHATKPSLSPSVWRLSADRSRSVADAGSPWEVGRRHGPVLAGESTGLARHLKSFPSRLPHLHRIHIRSEESHGGRQLRAWLFCRTDPERRELL